MNNGKMISTYYEVQLKCLLTLSGRVPAIKTVP